MVSGTCVRRYERDGTRFGTIVPTRSEPMPQITPNGRPGDRGLRRNRVAQWPPEHQRESVTGGGPRPVKRGPAPPIRYWKTAPGLSRLSEPSSSRLSTPRATATRSMTRVCALSASTTSLTSAFPSGLFSPSIWS